ncbi:TLDc domain-containing protein, partial [Blyttiomyces helicus]
LPPLLREAPVWTLVYSLEQHGISLNTLYQLTSERDGPQLLVIRDANGGVFGAFGSDHFAVRSGYYGTGTCFLWKKLSDGELVAYAATGKNDYLMLSEPHFIALGGGNGDFGLWIDDELYHGHSAPCDTFNNDQLSSTVEFRIVGLEVWAFEI